MIVEQILMMSGILLAAILFALWCVSETRRLRAYDREQDIWLLALLFREDIAAAEAWADKAGLTAEFERMQEGKKQRAEARRLAGDG